MTKGTEFHVASKAGFFKRYFQTGKKNNPATFFDKIFTCVSRKTLYAFNRRNKSLSVLHQQAFTIILLIYFRIQL